MSVRMGAEFVASAQALRVVGPRATIVSWRAAGPRWPRTDCQGGRRLDVAHPASGSGGMATR
eukprot:4945171-Pyramimonas_sp.AAC.1